MIQIVTEENIMQAAEVYSISWKESHCAICDQTFIERHTPDHQRVILQRRIEQGTAVYLLTDAGGPVGIVSVFDDLIADLYVLPEKQGKGYGTVLLQFAVEHCRGMPVLWILSSNTAARRLYERYGFRLTGNKKPLRSDLAELEMVLDQCAHKKLHLAGAGKTCQIL